MSLGLVVEPGIDIPLHLILGTAIASLDLAFELFTDPLIWVRSSSVS